MNGLKISLAGAVLLLAAPSAMGANVESNERAAKKACLVGDVDKGAEILADLYVDTNDATYIYNQGRCFEQNGKNEQAVLRFKEYLRKAKNLSPADSEAVQKKIEELQGTAGHRETQPEPLAAPAPALRPGAPAAVSPATSAIPASAGPATTPDPLGISRTTPLPEPQETAPIYKRWWFWTGIGAVVVGGVVTAILLRPKSGPTRATCDVGVACAP